MNLIETLARLKELESRATPGEWSVDGMFEIVARNAPTLMSGNVKIVLGQSR